MTPYVFRFVSPCNPSLQTHWIRMVGICRDLSECLGFLPFWRCSWLRIRAFKTAPKIKRLRKAPNSRVHLSWLVHPIYEMENKTCSKPPTSIDWCKKKAWLPLNERNSTSHPGLVAGAIQIRHVLSPTDPSTINPISSHLWAFSIGAEGSPANQDQGPTWSLIFWPRAYLLWIESLKAAQMAAGGHLANKLSCFISRQVEPAVELRVGRDDFLHQPQNQLRFK